MSLWRVRVSPRTQIPMGMRHQFPHMQHDEIKQQLDALNPDIKPDIILACWGIAFGRHREDLHCGTHMQNIRGCIESLQQLPSLQKQLRRQVDELWASGRTIVRVLCICETYVHKSVAVAAIMQEIYHQEGYKSKGPQHISRCEPDAICWRCRKCRPNVEKDKLMSFVQADYIRQDLLSC